MGKGDKAWPIRADPGVGEWREGCPRVPSSLSFGWAGPERQTEMLSHPRSPHWVRASLGCLPFPTPILAHPEHTTCLANPPPSAGTLWMTATLKDKAGAWGDYVPTEVHLGKCQMMLARGRWRAGWPSQPTATAPKPLALKGSPPVMYQAWEEVWGRMDTCICICVSPFAVHLDPSQHC